MVHTFIVYCNVELELTIQLINSTTVRLSWPASPPGFILETRLALTPGASWMPVTAQPTEIDGDFVLTLPIEGLQFFQLVR